MNFRFADEKFTGFKPQSAEQAIMKFRRLQATGISPFQYPETFVSCASELSDEEAEKFESWLIAPQGEPGPECLPVQTFSEDNLKVHNQLLLKQSDEDEKCAA
jgi:hypothetical protein